MSDTSSTPGNYRIRAAIPAHLFYPDITVTVTDRGCVPLDIWADYAGEIAGRVLNTKGNPLRDVAVSLVLADASPEHILAEVKDRKFWRFTFTDSDGLYRFNQIAPGRYLLVINRTEFESSRAAERWRMLPRLFYPGVNTIGGATVIEVGEEQQEGYDFRLPVP